MAAEWGITLRIMHTSGVNLVSCDAISRGRLCIPPRQRLSLAEFSGVDSQWGPFEEGIGAEMEHVLPSTLPSADKRAAAVRGGSARRRAHQNAPRLPSAMTQ